MKNLDINTAKKENFQEIYLKKIERKSWSELTTFGIGSAIVDVIYPKTDNEIRDILNYGNTKNIKVIVLGNGSNIIGSDSYSDCLVAKLTKGDFAKIEKISDGLIKVGAGVNLKKLANSLLNFNLGGIASLTPIPATVGGAIKMNAGAGGIEIVDFISEIFGLDAVGKSWSLKKNEINWSYRHTDIQEGFIITGSICKFNKVCPNEEYELIKQASTLRKETSPIGKSAGCIFKNISTEISAGKLIDKLNLKGQSIGGIEISSKHANYMINLAKGTELDCFKLITKVITKVESIKKMYLKMEAIFINPRLRKEISEVVKVKSILVMMGGASSERAVSIISGQAVAKALKIAGYAVTELDLRKLELPMDINEYDIVFPVFHGDWGEDGRLYDLLERENIPFVGCNSATCAIVMNKVKTKQMLDKQGILTAKYDVLCDMCKKPKQISYPLILKPSEEGSTVGIKYVKDSSEWDESLKFALQFSNEILLEEYISGCEITVSVIKGKVFPIVEIQYPGKIYDYDAKYEHKFGKTQYFSPPISISTELQDKAKQIALRFCDIVGSSEIMRIDMIITAKNEIFVIEGNTLPGFTPDSLLPKAAQAADISFIELCSKLVALK